MKRLRLETLQSEVTGARRRADLTVPLLRAFARPRMRNFLGKNGAVDVMDSQ
jgi:hypothetical protein